MGIYDRDYTHDNYGHGQGPQVRFVVPKPSPGVKWLLIINIAVFFITFFLDRHDRFFCPYFSVYPINLVNTLQIWRLITYQFLHGGVGHIFLNMLVLYFFGPLFERMWGTKKFLKFYLICGAAGGIVYPILVFMKFLSPGYLIGASGSIFGMLAAAAILFPQMRVYVFGIFPLKMAVLAIILVAISFLHFLSGPNAGGEAAHLAGMAAGAVYVLWKPLLEKNRRRAEQSSWANKVEQQRRFQAEVDRILEKVHNSGINSLTRKEKSMLKRATEMEQKR